MARLSIIFYNSVSNVIFEWIFLGRVEQSVLTLEQDVRLGETALSDVLGRLFFSLLKSLN